MIGVCVSGARGRMGRLLVDLVQAASDLRLVSALERPEHPELGMPVGGGVALTDDAQAAIAAGDVLLDFSLAEAVPRHVGIAAERDKAVVIGATGFLEEQREAILRKAKRVPVVMSSNMSRGIHLLAKLVEQAAKNVPEHAVEILELHHEKKVDAPSGTALQLAEVVSTARGGAQSPVVGRRGQRQPEEIGIASLRGGDLVGEHQVMFLGPGEQLILTHRATSREHFCRGALAAVRFVFGRPAGLYSMADVFKEV